jgi:hypothetical protein|tara:strand:+ start:722 stop:1033 length:312 start_codon:yes stop_codon:yes gene_type:complete
MAIEYTFSRVEPSVICAGQPDEGKVCSVVVGMTAVEGDHSAYIDTTVPLSGAGVVDPESLDLSAICNGAATDGDWKANLAAQIESQKAQPHTWTGVATPPSVS